MKSTRMAPLRVVLMAAVLSAMCFIMLPTELDWTTWVKASMVFALLAVAFVEMVYAWGKVN